MRIIYCYVELFENNYNFHQTAQIQKAIGFLNQYKKNKWSLLSQQEYKLFRISILNYLVYEYSTKNKQLHLVVISD